MSEITDELDGLSFYAKELDRHLLTDEPISKDLLKNIVNCILDIDIDHLEEQSSNFTDYKNSLDDINHQYSHDLSVAIDKLKKIENIINKFEQAAEIFEIKNLKAGDISDIIELFDDVHYNIENASETY